MLLWERLASLIYHSLLHNTEQIKSPSNNTFNPFILGYLWNLKGIWLEIQNKDILYKIPLKIDRLHSWIQKCLTNSPSSQEV